MPVISGGWKRQSIGVYRKQIGSREYEVSLKSSGYWMLTWFNPAEIFGYRRRIDYYGSFEIATLAAEVHSAQFWKPKKKGRQNGQNSK